MRRRNGKCVGFADNDWQQFVFLRVKDKNDWQKRFQRFIMLCYVEQKYTMQDGYIGA